MLVRTPTRIPDAIGDIGSLTTVAKKPSANLDEKAPRSAVRLSGNASGSIRSTSMMPMTRPRIAPNVKRPTSDPPALSVSAHRLRSCEFVRRARPRCELPVDLCWSGEPDFHVPAIRGRLLAFLDSAATDVACGFQREDQRGGSGGGA